MMPASRNLEGLTQNTKQKHLPTNGFHGWLDTFNPIGKNVRSLSSATDHGFQPWLQVALSHIANANTFGIINSFGIFQPYYVTHLASRPSPSTVSWIGSLQIFFVYSLGAASGRAVDGGYFHLTVFIGLLMQIIGMLATSFCTELWQLFLAQGLCIGIGNGLVFCPVVALVSTWFGSRRRALALSIVASGGGTGGLIFPAVAQSLLYKIGFAWTVRIMTFIMLFNAILVLLFTQARTSQQTTPRPAPLIDWKAFREISYLLYTIGIFFTLWGTFFAFYFVRPFARDILHTSQHTSFSILLTINGVGIPGRILPALLSTLYLGPLNTLIPCVLFAAVLLYTWIPVHDLAGLYIFASIFGIWGAAIQALFPAAISSLSMNGDPIANANTEATNHTGNGNDTLVPEPEPELEPNNNNNNNAAPNRIGARIGMVFTVASPACLSGPPIAGALIQAAMNSGNGESSSSSTYLGAQIFGGSVMVIGTVILVAARVKRTGRKIWVRI